MASAAKLKNRLHTISNLNAIFSSLQVITTIQVKQVRDRHTSFSAYLKELETAAAELDFLPFLQPAGGTTTTLAILVSGNRGLCGNFNTNLFYRAQSFIKETEGELKFLVFGKKGQEFLKKKGAAVEAAYLHENYSFDFFENLAEKIYRRYQAGEIADVTVIFNRFKTVVSQFAYAFRLIPPEAYTPPEFTNYILEPDGFSLAEKLFRRLLAARLYSFYLDSRLGEVSNRMVTLRGAIESSDELIDGLRIDLNKARQQAITRELLELIGAAESLRGVLKK